MTVTEQIERNGKIARFMGDGLVTMDSSHFQYHNSWDWLMPVVEKLHNTRGIVINIGSYQVYLHLLDGIQAFMNDKCGSKITAVYQAVCAGVDWVEKNKSI